MKSINTIIKYIAYNGSKKQFQNAACRRANNGKPNLGKLLTISSIEEWQPTEADKQAIRAGLKTLEECDKPIYAAGGRVRRIYENTHQIPVASKELREQVAKNYENRKQHKIPKNWTPKFEDKKPWTKVDALHGLAVYRLSKWDALHPAPVTEDESDILTHKKRRADAFSKIVTRILNDTKPKVVYRVLIYGNKNYSLDETETYYFDTFTKYETALRAFIDNTLRVKKEHSDYTRAELTGFGKKYEKGFKVFEYDQRGHMADILYAHKHQIDMSWYSRMSMCDMIETKRRNTIPLRKTVALAA